MPAEVSCADAPIYDARLVAVGAADSRFHAGTFRGSDFPTDASRAVRVDLWSGAQRLAPGHRLVLVASAGSARQHLGPTRPTLITLRAGGGAEASHLVLPLVEGTLGGAPPTLAYPPRPFVSEVAAR